MITNLKSNYSIENADPSISQHAIFWVICGECYASSRKTFIDGWLLIINLTTDDIVVYQKNNTFIIGFRGTVDFRDFINDIQLSLPGNVCDFNRVFPSYTFVNDLMSDNDEIILTGHSLGGAIARCVSSQLNLPSVTFNAAAPPSNPVFNSSLETSYHIVYDIVSAWQEPDIIRIDKNYRPWKSKLPFIGKTVTRLVNTFIVNSLKPMTLAHSLDNFSNEIPGYLITADDEDFIWQDWIEGLPRIYKEAFLNFLNINSLPKV